MIITSVIASSPRRSVPLLGRIWANTVPRLDHRVQPAHQQSRRGSICYTRVMNTKAYDWTAYTLAIALQTAAPEGAAYPNDRRPIKCGAHDHQRDRGADTVETGHIV